ncbi:ras-domain-containing protein [Aureobasidium pullulans]|nr:ras-domain-containing protein [Aureobasidium pullulans]
MSAPSTSLEAKLVVLGSQNVGKTSLVHRFVHQTFLPPSTPSTVGASFLTTRVHDPETDTDIRLQIWDTAGQERFRSISKLYYRGAHAAVLCYDITSKKSFEEMGVWLRELRDKTGWGDAEDLILHVVGTKSDVVAEDPSKREVPFERCIGYVAEQLYPDQVASSNGRPPSALHSSSPASNGNLAAMASPHSNRSSGFWGQEHIWDCCHEISAKDGEGIEEMFRVITRKLVDQHQRKLDQQRTIEATMGRTPFAEGGQSYFDLPNGGTGSFRVGHGDKRRSWLGFPNTPGAVSYTSEAGESEDNTNVRKGRCC